MEMGLIILLTKSENYLRREMKVLIDASYADYDKGSLVFTIEGEFAGRMVLHSSGVAEFTYVDGDGEHELTGTYEDANSEGLQSRRSGEDEA
jgi:hypothetical protein